jgi:biopolymer transport protein ExbD
MNRDRALIRLIDVALIVLMAFIAVSQLKTGYVDLPEGDDDTPAPLATNTASLHIYRDYFIIKDDRKQSKVGNLQELESVLAEKNRLCRSRQSRLVINLEPEKSSIAQNLIDVIDICQRNKIEKSLNFENFD